MWSKTTQGAGNSWVKAGKRAPECGMEEVPEYEIIEDIDYETPESAPFGRMIRERTPNYALMRAKKATRTSAIIAGVYLGSALYCLGFIVLLIGQWMGGVVRSAGRELSDAYRANRFGGKDNPTSRIKRRTTETIIHRTNEEYYD